jgi:hypothetical protein
MTSLMYIDSVPKHVPPGTILVHNHIRHSARTPIGLNGFRAWLAYPSPRYVRCRCKWTATKHYRVDFARAKAEYAAIEKLVQTIGEQRLYDCIDQLVALLSSDKTMTDDEVEALAEWATDVLEVRVTMVER